MCGLIKQSSLNDYLSSESKAVIKSDVETNHDVQSNQLKHNTAIEKELNELSIIISHLGNAHRGIDENHLDTGNQKFATSIAAQNF